MEILGIDVGGSGIKGAPVETTSGAMLAERLRIPTPEGAKPKPVARAVAEIVESFHWTGPIGIGFPAAIQHGVCRTASNIHKKWLELDTVALFEEAIGQKVVVVNDADAAGLAEMTYGAGRGQRGVVLIITIGTGLGTALFTNGQLLPNAELGHIEINGVEAEVRASDAARKREDLSIEKWTRRFDEYLVRLEKLLWPDLIILGGGGGRKADRFIPSLHVRAAVVPAQLENEAGIIGAALAARPASA
jgi:polyphosphate glucokinase